MHVEIQVALNFIISYLYNKLPRRRVNIFGEELEKGLKKKFQGHWYADKPFKGSGYRCVRVSNQLDPVIEEAARESGIEVEDVRGNLPADLSVWIDPSEVSYKIGEKGAVKILYSDDNNDEHLDHEVRRSFNPEAQSFKPIDSLSSSMSNLSASPSSPHGSSPSPPAKSTSPVTTFIPKTTVPLTFTTATFAQTKFGSTKLKTSAKRNSQRMSPTEFSQYIKQRSMLQQIARSRSSNPMVDYYNGQQHQWLLDNNFLGENFPQGSNGLSDLSYLTNETTKAFLDVPPHFNQYPLLMAN